MLSKKYILSLITVYTCYFTHGMQAILLSQNKSQFFTSWGISNAIDGAVAVSMAITATGFGKLISVWIGGVVSDRIGRKKMAFLGAFLYVLSFLGLMIAKSLELACVCAFLSGVATSGFWDASLGAVVQESVHEKYTGAAVIGIKAFISLAGILFPIICVYFQSIGMWRVNIIIPLVFSIICLVMSLCSSYIYDDNIKEHRTISIAEKTDEKAKVKFLVNICTMFYGFFCMIIMYGAQQYTKAFGINNCGLSEMQSASLTSIYTVGSILAVIFWALTMTKLKFTALKVLLIDSVFIIFAIIIVLAVRNVVVIYIAIALLGFFAAGGALQTGIRLRQELCKGAKGRNIGVYYTFMGLASMILPYIVSKMITVYGEPKAVYNMMIIMLISAIISLVMLIYLAFEYKKMYGKSAL